MGLFDSFKKASAPKGGGAFPAAATASLDQRGAAILQSTNVARIVEKRLLFVGVGEDWLTRIESDLLRLHPTWELNRVPGMPEAIAALATGDYSTVVFNSIVPAETSQLSTIEKLPNLVRLVLCASTERSEIARWSAVGANLLSQATDADTLSANINRLARVQEWMADVGMKKLLAQCRKLPAMPSLFSQVTAELGSPTGSIDTVADHIARDPVMTAKLLQIVNSAFFALGREVTNAREAVLFLGAERTRSLILLAGVFTQYENVKCPGFSAEQIWNHSLQVGNLSRTVAITETRSAKIAEAAFTAGLIHDMGKLILAANVPSMCQSIEQIYAGKQVTQREAELQVLGTTHAELAACLIGTWALPLPVLEAVAWHHTPLCSNEQSFSLLTAVHAANVFAYELGCGSGGKALPEKFDHAYLEQIGLGDRRNDWRKACKIPERLEEDIVQAGFRARRAAKRN